jgi:hypothetical protein
MSYSYTSKDNQAFDNKDISVNFPPTLLDASPSSASSSVTSSASSSESAQQQIANRRVVKSCMFSTIIFSINFVSSILVINLSKW